MSLLDSPESLIRQILLTIGEDPDRDGLKETPHRVVKAWGEAFAGYRQNPADILKCFEHSQDEMVIVQNIPYLSKCEHHMENVEGIAHIGYVPKGRIVGLSKFARLVDCFGRRLQVQERATAQIADAFMEHVKPLGVGVIIRAKHACMSTRGVKAINAVTHTSAMRGVFMKGKPRAEFFSGAMSGSIL